MDIIERLSEVFRLYRICLQLTDQGLGEVSSGENEALTEVIERRTEVLARIKHLEKELPAKRQDNGTYLLAVPETQAKAVEKLLVDLKAVMADLTEADRRLRQGIEETLNRLGADLQKIRRGYSVLKSYAPFRRSLSYYVDRQS